MAEPVSVSGLRRVDVREPLRRRGRLLAGYGESRYRKPTRLGSIERLLDMMENDRVKAQIESSMHGDIVE